MPTKRHSSEQIISKLREAKIPVTAGTVKLNAVSSETKVC